MDEAPVSKRDLHIAVIPGDGIGPEVMREGLKVLKAALGKVEAPRLIFSQVEAGAELYRRTRVAFPEVSRRICWEAHAVFLAAAGLPDVTLPDGTGVTIAWPLRKDLDLFAGIRPVTLFHERLTPLKGKKAGDIRLTIVRENTEGIYASRGAGVVMHDQVAVNPIVITRLGTERIMKKAFETASRGRGAPGDGQKRVTCVDKSNVLSVWAFFRKIFHETAQDFPDVAQDVAYIDALSMLVVRQPEFYDVIVAENQHGDVLSDLLAGLVGGLGFAPSANIGEHKAMFEPAHGTAPALAGKDLANPVATILSGAMMLDWLSAEHGEEGLAQAARLIEQATAEVLGEGKILTADAGGTAGTARMGDAIAEVVAIL